MSVPLWAGRNAPLLVNESGRGAFQFEPQQVIPFDAGAHPGMPGSFHIIKFPGDEDPDVVYVDSMAGDLFLETEPEIQRYTLAFEHLRAVALSPADSRVLIAGIAEVT
jgi:hypothetical protein